MMAAKVPDKYRRGFETTRADSKGVHRTHRPNDHGLTTLKLGDTVYCKYMDHVQGHRVDPLVVSPQVRECLAWLVYRCPEYVTLVLDRDAGPPMLKSGDRKADVLCLLRGDIVELRRLGGD